MGGEWESGRGKRRVRGNREGMWRGERERRTDRWRETKKGCGYGQKVGVKWRIDLFIVGTRVTFAW